VRVDTVKFTPNMLVGRQVRHLLHPNKVFVHRVQHGEGGVGERRGGEEGGHRTRCEQVSGRFTILHFNFESFFSISCSSLANV